MATYIKTLKKGDDVYAPRTVAEAVLMNDGVTTVQDEIDTINTALSSKVEQSDINTAISGLIDSAPATLDTLNELSAALGDDANFATTVTNAIAAKAPLESPTFTGTPTAPTAVVDTNTTQIATTAFAKAQIAQEAPRKSALTGTLVNYIWSGTQAQYDAIGTKDANTLYFIVG